VVDRAWGPSTVFERLRNLGSAQRRWSDFRTRDSLTP
jgi:hypothetical protein